MIDPFQFYGLDWLATMAQLVSMDRVAKKKRDTFLWKGAATLFYLGFHLLVGSIPGAAISVLFLWMNYRAWRMWGE